ncbi:MAG: thiamine phosphate synthase, partial [Vicinamibacteria bacterium]
MVALPARPFLYAILDTSRLGARGVGAAVAEVAQGGAGLVQLRAKGAADGVFLEWAREAVAAARRAGVPILINDRADIARLA